MPKKRGRVEIKEQPAVEPVQSERKQQHGYIVGSALGVFRGRLTANIVRAYDNGTVATMPSLIVVADPVESRCSLVRRAEAVCAVLKSAQPAE